MFNLCMYFTDFDNEEITLKAILAIGKEGFQLPIFNKRFTLNHVLL